MDYVEKHKPIVKSEDGILLSNMIKAINHIEKSKLEKVDNCIDLILNYMVLVNGIKIFQKTKKLDELQKLSKK